jgi:NlpC/P60 family protein
VITRLLVPTTIPTSPPPPPGPTLPLAGLHLLDNPGLGGNLAVARTALRHFGEYYRPDGVPWVGWCEMFVGNVLAEAGLPQPRYASALADALSGPLYRGAAPAGSLVFFDQRSSPYGHVGISLGDGTMLSALGGGVVRTTYGDWVSYLGWRPYGTTTPTEAPINLQVYSVATPDDGPVHGQAVAVPLSADVALALLQHAEQITDAALDRLTPPVREDWGILPSRLLMPRHTTM